MYLLGLDVGTTGSKAIVFDLEGHILGYGFCEYGIIAEKPGYAEQDAEAVWQITKGVIQKAIETSGLKQIHAMSLSVQGDAVIPVDPSLLPLHNALLGMDYRTVEEMEICKTIFGDQWLFEQTGMRPHPLNSLTKILWFKRNMPDLYEKTYKFMTYADFILCKLGARPIIDYTMASRTMAFDLHTKKWSDKILKELDLDIDKLSEPRPSGERVGWLSNDLVELWGLEKSIELVTGGHDQTCAALGAGVINEKIAIDSHGTAEVVSTAFSQIKNNSKMYSAYYPCYCHVVENMYFTFSLNHIGGILLKWFRDQFAFEERQLAEQNNENAYTILLERAPEEPSHLMVLPHFNGSGTPWCDLQSKGAIVGLTMHTTKEDFTKGIIDSLSYELRINLETMQEAGILISELRCVGGAAHSPKWLQVKADITKCTVKTLQVREAACLGAALLAATSIGGYHSLEEAVSRTVRIDQTYVPNLERSIVFDEKYAVYKDLYKALKSIHERM
ncbi:MAG: hypothetical protein H7X94_00595 [Vallitaleaceae bacterium]|nr:hypothetical protein [Vallitaleaceae bacterium]